MIITKSMQCAALTHSVFDRFTSVVRPPFFLVLYRVYLLVASE